MERLQKRVEASLGLVKVANILQVVQSSIALDEEDGFLVEMKLNTFDA